MKKLIVLRHGKSSWDDADLTDHDRPLGPRGERSAVAMGRYMEQHDLVPHHILCSTALRAQETLALARTQWRSQPPVVADPRLYLSGTAGILAAIAEAPDGAASLLIVGHNPDLQELIVLLAGSEKASLRRQVEEKYPTGALAVLTFPRKHWRDVAKGEGDLTALTLPKDLI